MKTASVRLTTWLGVTGLLLVATLLAAAFVQVRQYALLNLTVQQQDDYLVLSLYQLETEYLRLRERWRTDADGPGDDVAALQLRYDIFLSRVALLRTERAARLLCQVPNAQQVLRQIDTFSARADLYLSGDAPARLSPQAARALLGELTALADPIHQLLLDASHQVAAQVTERRDQVRQHNEVGLALTAFLSAMVLVFALIALRQMRKLEHRRQRLETLATELRDARTEAEAASTAKSEFLADMSHELRTPLHGLMGMLSLLKDAPADAQAAQWLQTADASATHLLRLLDDILDLSKLESGSLQLTPQDVDLRALVQDVKRLMQAHADDKGLKLDLRFDGPLPPHVRLDPTRTRQVLYNLLNNAIKFSNAGTVTLCCRQRNGSEGQPQLEFDVIDSGIGMDQATVARLFQRFSRADDPQARRQGGTGLGLAISRNLARLMDGEIVVRSAPGAGSVFSFRCPLVAATPAAPEEAPPAPAAPRTLRVLVAEDHPVNRLYIAALLERLGHQGHFSTNGLEAVQALRQQDVDLVLMDVHMPVMDGVAASEAIRALPPPAGQVRIVALTADVFADTRERCLKAGIDEVITKPVSLQDLTTLLARHFGTAEGAPAVAPPAPSITAAPTSAEKHAPADPSAPAQAPLLDPAAVRSVAMLMGPERAPVLYDGFFEQAAEAGRRMRDAMRAAEVGEVQRAAHAVKGAALNLGLPALAEAAAGLNRDAGTLGAAQLALAVQRYEELVGATRAVCAAEGWVEGGRARV
jgi:two-component system, sensor histidine kinase